MNQTSGVTPTTQRDPRTEIVARWLCNQRNGNGSWEWLDRDGLWVTKQNWLEAADELLCLLYPEQPPFIRDLGELVSELYLAADLASLVPQDVRELLRRAARVLNSGEHSVQGSSDTPSAEKLAQTFHEVYERLAPEFGYETRKDSAVQWEDVPEKNRRLMTATCGVILSYLFPLAAMTAHSSEGQQP